MQLTLCVQCCGQMRPCQNVIVRKFNRVRLAEIVVSGKHCVQMKITGYNYASCNVFNIVLLQHAP